MKKSVGSKILAFAKERGGWFSATDVRQAIKAKPERIYVELSVLKKKGLLNHDAAARKYILNQNSKTVQVTAPTAAQPKPKQPAFDPAIMLDNILKQVQQTEEKYEDALAIIRYLENKLYVAIQRDVDHNRGIDAGG